MGNEESGGRRTQNREEEEEETGTRPISSLSSSITTDEGEEVADGGGEISTIASLYHSSTNQKLCFPPHSILEYVFVVNSHVDYLGKM
jgi:hypothetical protein